MGINLDAPLIYAVVPAWNEAKSLPSLLEELEALRAELPGFRWVVVNDGSTDATGAYLASRTDLHAMSFLSLPFNLGIGVAVQTGFKFALEQGAQWIVQIDGDGQHVPGELPKLLQAIRSEKADLAIGSRYAQRLPSPGLFQGARASLRSTSLPRFFGSRILSALIRITTGLRVLDPTSGFRLFSRQAAELIAQQYSDDYPEVDSILEVTLRGLKIIEVPVTMRPRRAGQSSISTLFSFYYMIKVSLAVLILRIQRHSQIRRAHAQD